MRYRAGYEEAARIAHNDAYADDPGALLPDARSWPQHATGLANFLPDASFLALPGPAEGQDIAGFLFSLEHHDSTGTGEGSLHCLGTRKPWRRRGLAITLIGHALAAYQLAGFTTARLQVDSTNTSALRLYNQLGFTASGRGYAMLQAAAPDSRPRSGRHAIYERAATWTLVAKCAGDRRPRPASAGGAGPTAKNTRMLTGKAAACQRLRRATAANAAQRQQHKHPTAHRTPGDVQPELD